MTRSALRRSSYSALELLTFEEATGIPTGMLLAFHGVSASDFSLLLPVFLNPLGEVSQFFL